MNEVSVFDQYAGEFDWWFEEHPQIYQAELSALRRMVPRAGFGVEIGVGTGRFAVPLGIRIGVEPSRAMARIAKARGIIVVQGVAEQLPFPDHQFDFAVLVTVICFVKDVARVLTETKRVIKVGGKIIIGFIDRNSTLGQLYQAKKDAHKFYKVARFYTASEVATLVSRVGFWQLQYCQTILGLPDHDPAVYQVRAGYGEGAFVVLGATKCE